MVTSLFDMLGMDNGALSKLVLLAHRRLLSFSHRWFEVGSIGS